MGVSNYTPTGISHATSVDFSKRSVSQPVHIVQYDRTLPILAVSLYNNGQLYRLSETMEVSIRLGKPDRTFVYNKALGCDSTRTIVYFEITQQMSLFDGEYYPVIEIRDGEKIANSSTIYLVVDRNPVHHDYIESTIEYKELVDYRDEAVNAGNEAKEAAKIAKDSVQTVVDKTKEAVEASETAVNAANSASESAESILGVEENVTRIGNMVSEKEPIITESAEVASTSATNARQSETNANASEEASKLSETNAKESETKAKASEEASKLSETNAKNSENESVKYGNLAKSYAVGTDNTIRENDSEDNAKTYCDAAKTSAGNAKQSEANAKTYLDKIIEKVDVTVDAEMSDTSENPVQNKVIKKYVDDHTPEVDDMTGATATQNGTHGLVPAPQAGDEKKVLLGDGKWGAIDDKFSFSDHDTAKSGTYFTDAEDGNMLVTDCTKNLLNPTLETTEQNGVTCTRNVDANGKPDGTYTLNGTASANCYFILNSNFNLESGKSYKLIGNPGKSDGSSSSSDYRLDFYNGNTYTGEYGRGAIVTAGTTNKTQIIISNGVTISNIVFKPMLTTDLNATYDDFVPYSGYDIKTCGKNIFKNYDHYGSYKVAEETYNGNSVIYSSTDWYGAYQSDLILKKGKTYAISAYVKGSGQWHIFCDRVDNAGEGIHISLGNTLSSEWTKITKVYTSSIDVHNVRIEMGGGSLYISCFQIEEGAQATDYEPYTGETITVTNDTESPAFGLKSHKGLTHIISPGNVKCMYPTNESGKGVLDAMYNNELSKLKNRIFTYSTKSEYDYAVANDEIPDGAIVIKAYDD